MRRVLLDTNTLLLWLVGNTRSERVGGKRLESFNLDDLVRLNDMLAGPIVHVSLPNVLTEVSNLIGSGKQSWGDDIQKAYVGYCHMVSEVYQPSADVVKTAEFAGLGLTDAAIYKMSSDRVEVFTVDFPLGNRLAKAGVKVVNLMHFKTPH